MIMAERRCGRRDTAKWLFMVLVSMTSNSGSFCRANVRTSSRARSSSPVVAATRVMPELNAWS